MNSLPWYQQPTYTGMGMGMGMGMGGSAMMGGLPFGMSSSSYLGNAPAGPSQSNDHASKGNSSQEYWCDSCEKDFAQESQYRAHTATHVKCTVDGCAFEGSQRVVKEHVQMTHGAGRPGANKGKKNGNSTGEIKISLDTPEEIARWREARAKNWPSNANIQRKKEAEQQRQSRGQPASLPSSSRQRGPAWKLSSGQQAQKGPVQQRVQQQQQQQHKAAAPKHKGQSGDASVKSESQLAAPALESLAGLGCYESSEDEAPEACTFAAAAENGSHDHDDASMHVNNSTKGSPETWTSASKSRGEEVANGTHNNSRQKNHEAASESFNANGRQKRKSGPAGKGGPAYQYHGTIQRKGGTLLDKLLKQDTHKQDALLLQAIRFLVSSETA